MEYKLNKVDPEVRTRVNEITKSGKVHSKNSIIINDDHKKDKKEEHKFEAELNKQRSKGKALEVEAVLDNGVVAAEDEKFVGTILDIRK
ncbi:MAG: hypothetical protein ACM3X7_11045 [Solirubrobacterales bacterium]